MTDNAKKALEFLKNNKEATEKLKKIDTLQGILDLAKEYNLDLKEEDLNITQEKKEILEGKKKMDISELEKVSGAGDVCACIVGGGGNGNSGIYCYCAVVGGGSTGNYETCFCFLGGGGNSENRDYTTPKC